MRTHFIFMSSSYSLGVRITLDFIVKNEETQKEIKKDFDKIIKECGRDVSISTHMIQAEGIEWSSVYKADTFFKNVKVIEGVDKFIEVIKKDRKLKGTDVAKYILTKVECTQLKLQKLVYLCFADYLCETDKKLFTDKIYAFKYGPVVDSIYKEYKKYGYKEIESEEIKMEMDSSLELPARSRILFAEDGTEKIISIDRTLKKYGMLTAAQLVELTHRVKAPWNMTKRKPCLSYAEMKDETIKKYHEFEKIKE